MNRINVCPECCTCYRYSSGQCATCYEDKIRGEVREMFKEPTKERLKKEVNSQHVNNGEGPLLT